MAITSSLEITTVVIDREAGEIIRLVVSVRLCVCLFCGGAHSRSSKPRQTNGRTPPGLRLIKR